MQIKSLEIRMFKIDWQEFLMTGDADLVDDLWANGENRAELESIIRKSSYSLLAKLIAAEILKKFGARLTHELHQISAEVYTNALKNSRIGSENQYNLPGNLWGFITEEDDAGSLGERIIQMGLLAVPHLKQLLEDEGTVLYVGSEEATIGNASQSRIKDFAAFYISKITHIPISIYHDLDRRDKEIEQFKGKMKEYGY